MVSAFLFALVAVFLTSLGSRDQLLVARISETLGRSFGLLFIGCVIAVGTALIMAWGGQYIAAMLPGKGKTMLIAFALGMAAVELAWPNKFAFMKEPTRSLGAISVVLAIRQLGDASRFIIFAFAAASATPWMAGIGGAMGGLASIFIAWFFAEELPAKLPLRAIRLLLAIILLLLAVYIGLTARGLLV